MAPCAIALQELLNICYRYSVEVNLNFNAKKSFCVAFTPKHYKLSLSPLFMNTLPIMYTDSIKYLGFTFTSNNCDDADIWKQMRMLHSRSNRLDYLISAVNQFYLSYVEVIELYFIVLISGQIIRKLPFQRYELHITTSIGRSWVCLDSRRSSAIVLCLSLTTFLTLNFFFESPFIHLLLEYNFPVKI